MKKNLLTLLLFSALSVMAQNTRFGIKTGMNYSIFSASINSEPGFKAGLNVGVYVKSVINDKLSFRPEVYYSQQGQKDNYVSNSGNTTTSVNYLNIPLLLEVGRVINFQLGPQVGILLNAHEKGTIQGSPVNDDLKKIMNSTEFAFVIGISGNLGKNINLGARLNKGLTDIFSPNVYPSVRNNVFHFYIGYLFNAKVKDEK